MGLDDAIRSARQQAEAHDTNQKNESERQQREREEIRRLLVEAVEHLRPYGAEKLVRVKKAKVFFFGQYLDSSGNGYRATSVQRCWKIAQMESRHPKFGVVMKSPVLLLEDGTAGRFWLDLGDIGHEGEYVTSIAASPLRWDTFGASSPMEAFPRRVERELATAIVRYERGK